MKKFILPVLLAATVVTISNCARNPVTGKKQLVTMSTEQELALGKEADPQIVAQFGLYEDSALQRYMRQKGQELAALSHRANINYEFRVVNSNVINAFAIPGYVYFTRGIMAHFNNEAQFEGVLGHELGHIAARHTVIQQRNATLGQVGLLAGMIASPTFGRFAEQASQGLGLLLLKNSRDAEREADRLGVEYSTKAGYDANEMATFFNTLKRQGEQQGEAIPNLLSTHPDPGERNQTVAQLATEWKQKTGLTNPKIARESYLRLLEGMVYGEDPREGFLEGGIFYHPVLKFQFPVPSGWAFQNSPQQVQMAPKDGKALLLLTLAQGKSLQEAASTTLQQYGLQAVGSRETTVNGLPALMVEAQQQQQQQQQQQGGAVVRTLSYFIQHSGTIYHLIGVSSSLDFNAYTSQFLYSMQSFKTVTDAAKLNKKPDRIRIKSVTQAGTAEQVFRKLNVSAERLTELAILNGVNLTDRVEQGSLIKVYGQ
ncbi:MAG TPA: M48 family metalloprotease [Flavisolibacter sp.]|jgi:predicted Zn-dependent protease|nr:M48 family metalloprotease [Flavisolibacter sp.]